MSQADRYRRNVLIHDIRPARKRGDEYIDIRLGDVRERMNLPSATDVGFALDTRIFRNMANVAGPDISGPESGTAANNVYTFRIL